MSRRIRFTTVVFVTTFVVNVLITAWWPDAELTWWASALVAGITALALALVFRDELGP